MKPSNNQIRHTCPVSQDQHFTDEFGNLICIKSYKGDWGDWDEKPANISDCVEIKDALDTNDESEN